MSIPNMTDSSKSTRTAVEQASRGDAEALDDLLERHLPDLERFVQRNAGSLLARRESCSDVVQSACREVLLDLRSHTWRGEEEFRAWLFTAAVRKMGNRVRHWTAGRRDVGLDASADPAPVVAHDAASPSREASAMERIDLMERVLDQLPASQREVFVLVRLAGLTYDEIASELGISAANARKLYSRAVAEIMVEWDDPAE